MATFKTKPLRPLQREELKKLLGMLVLEKELRDLFKREPQKVAEELNIPLTEWEINFALSLLNDTPLPEISLDAYPSKD